MLNNIVIVGRLTRDPEIRTTPAGMSVASFTLASDDSRRGPNGEKQTVFIPVSVFGKPSEVVGKFTRKGSLVGVTGRLIQRKYVRRSDNVEITSTEIVASGIELMEPKGTNPGQDAGYRPDPIGNEGPSNQVEPDMGSEGGNLDPLIEDDLPF
ncbi:MAG: single-stranded DNA-binding protein [Bacilli bacterium]|nr:single-stranded DNA-binding protein [Bacilli bacterium]